MLGFAMGSAGHRGKLGKSAMGQVGHRGKLATHDLTSSVLLCTIPAVFFCLAKMTTLGFDKPCAALYYSSCFFFCFFAKTDIPKFHNDIVGFGRFCHFLLIFVSADAKYFPTVPS